MTSNGTHSSPSGPSISRDEETRRTRDKIAEAIRGMKQVRSNIIAEGGGDNHETAELLRKLASAAAPQDALLHQKAMGQTRRNAIATSRCILGNLVDFTGKGGHRRKNKVRPNLFSPGLSMGPRTQTILGSLCQSLNSASYDGVDKIVGTSLLNAASWHGLRVDLIGHEKSKDFQKK
jgi:hypothetical protein